MYNLRDTKEQLPPIVFAIAEDGRVTTTINESSIAALAAVALPTVDSRTRKDFLTGKHSTTYALPLELGAQSTRQLVKKARTISEEGDYSPSIVNAAKQVALARMTFFEELLHLTE